jgi:transposase-like protein
VRPDREPLSGRVEVDETYVGGLESSAKGRQTETKSRVAIAVELHEPKGYGRIRVHRIPDVSKASLIAFVQGAAAPGSTIRTDGWRSYLTLPDHGYTHERIVMTDADDRAHVAMPAVHRVASLLKRWLLGTHQGAVGPQHLDAYLNEFTFRFNRRTSTRRGLLFHRLLQQAVLTPPTTYKDTVRPDRRTLNCG